MFWTRVLFGMPSSSKPVAGDLTSLLPSAIFFAPLIEQARLVAYPQGPTLNHPEHPPSILHTAWIHTQPSGAALCERIQPLPILSKVQVIILLLARKPP